MKLEILEWKNYLSYSYIEIKGGKVIIRRRDGC